MTVPSPAPSPASTAARRFQLHEIVGRGGFGTVWRSSLHDVGGFSRQVALKLMHYEGPAAEEVARRMRDEARVLGLILEYQRDTDQRRNDSFSVEIRRVLVESGFEPARFEAASKAGRASHAAWAARRSKRRTGAPRRLV
jgi:hypothetical protein